MATEDLMAVGAVEWWPLERVLPYARNAKTHDEAGVAQLAGMIKRPETKSPAGRLGFGRAVHF